MNSFKLLHKRILMLCMIVLLCIGCGKSSSGEGEKKAVSSNTGFVPATPGNYDSKDLAVVVKINESEGTITFQTTYIGKKYTLNYDGATVFKDKYGQGISLKQLKEGDLVNVAFMKARKRLDHLQVESDSFSFYDVADYEISANGKNITIGNNKYSFDDNVVVITANGIGNLMDINKVDKITVKGKDHIAYSVVVEQGHGYIRLVNDSYFVGGWIEITDKQIYQIQPDMVIPVPVGSYPVTVSNKGNQGVANVTIVENEEYELDVSKWQGEAKYGKILFTVDPETAKIYIDGKVTDISEAVELEYGIHQMIVIANGYQTISKYIKVGSESSSVDITMEKSEGEEDENNPDESVSSNSTSDNTVSDNVVITPPTTESTSKNSVSINEPASREKEEPVSTSGDYKVHIDSPEDVEVYVDGSYVGIAPTSFAKKEGQVVITLRKDGYQTRSYTLSIDNSKKDSNYAFSALIPIQ